MSNACSRRMLVVGLAACAASTLSVYELRAQQPMHDRTRQGDATKMKASRALCYFSSLKGMNVNDASGSKVTDIKDVVFDRNSGDIMGYVVDADEDRLLSPHDIRAMLKDDGTVTLTSNLSAEAIKTRQQFEAGAFDESNPTSHREWWDRYEVDATKWSDYGDATDMDNHDNTNRDTNRDSNRDTNRDTDRDTDRQSQRDWTERLNTTSTPVQREGEVIAVDRVSGGPLGYRTIIEVRDQSGKTEKLYLGPTWYLSDQSVLPRRGQRITYKALPAENIDGATYAVTEVGVNGGKMVTLRQGNAYDPAWTSGRSNMTSAWRPRVNLASNIVGDNVYMQDTDSCDVEDLVIDVKQGRVLALAIDPDENFLGIGDKSRLVPLSVANITRDGKIYLDASQSMLTNSPVAPRSFKDLNNAWNLDEIFNQRPIVYR